MDSVHLVECEAYDVLGKCQNFLDSFVIWDNYFRTEGVVVKTLGILGVYWLLDCSLALACPPPLLSFSPPFSPSSFFLFFFSSFLSEILFLSSFLDSIRKGFVIGIKG